VCSKACTHVHVHAHAHTLFKRRDIMQLHTTQDLTYTEVLINIADPPYICLTCHQLRIFCLRAECCPTILQDSKHRAIEEWIQFCRFIWKNIQDACTAYKNCEACFSGKAILTGVQRYNFCSIAKKSNYTF
jgi:hypothetical protein